MEVWDILDKNGNPTGKTVVRGKRGLSKGEYHLVVHIWVIDKNGNFLIQRRSDDRPLMPGEWAATGGSAFSNESSRHAAKRELCEELGIDLDSGRFTLAKRMLRRFSITDVWAVRYDTDISKLVLQSDEVSQVNWLSPSQMRQIIKNGDFHNYGKDYFDLVFSIKDIV